MLPVLVVKDLLENDKRITSFISPNSIHILSIPEGEIDIEKTPLIRINELSDYQSSFANNRSVAVMLTVQIDVWSPDPLEIGKAKTVLDKLMEESGWAQIGGLPLTEDPDVKDFYRIGRRYRATQTINLK
ncbi:hypothetical protein [Terribacillus sp. 7520-G]|uniref:hypothetical protein n=1 Tax=Terribacillus sp. 7520-G TaxID=2025389 RepID=UPI000BA61638|nr:hypothetical protein [Terribacillus sp. 7520-G]PAD39816.1 hypothetical protein CHH53_04030 [Terribacillus sp. 7520-G]